MGRKKYFKEKIDGYTIKDLLGKLKYSEKNLKDRLNIVDDILNSSAFFEEYFSEYYDAEITTDTPLSMEDNVCKALESFGSYILNSEEIVKENRQNKIEYKFISTNSYLESKINRENHMKDEFNNSDINIIPFVKKDNNYLKVKDQKIYNEDYCKPELGDILKQYQTFIDLATKEREQLPGPSTRNFFLSRFVSEARLDMKRVKDAYEGTIYFKNITNSPTPHNIDDIDYTNPNVMGELMRMSPSAFEINDLAIIGWDFEEIVKRANLDEIQMETLDLYRRGYNKREIAEEMFVSRTSVHRRLEVIKKKLIKNV